MTKWGLSKHFPYLFSSLLRLLTFTSLLGHCSKIAFFLLPCLCFLFYAASSAPWPELFNRPTQSCHFSCNLWLAPVSWRGQFQRWTYTTFAEPVSTSPPPCEHLKTALSWSGKGDFSPTPANSSLKGRVVLSAESSLREQCWTEEEMQAACKGHRGEDWRTLGSLAVSTKPEVNRWAPSAAASLHTPAAALCFASSRSLVWCHKTSNQNHFGVFNVTMKLFVID